MIICPYCLTRNNFTEITCMCDLPSTKFLCNLCLHTFKKGENSVNQDTQEIERYTIEELGKFIYLLCKRSTQLQGIHRAQDLHFAQIYLNMIQAKLDQFKRGETQRARSLTQPKMER